MVARWGAKILNNDDTLNRAAVAAIVFDNKDELDALNAIVHPTVGKEMEKRRANPSTDVTILDIPLLVTPTTKSKADIASHYQDLAAIVVVDTEEEIAIDRLVTHRGFTPEQAQARISQQASRETRLAVADFVIENNSTLADLHAQIETCWQWIQTL